jgi:acylphosphatase
MPAHVPDLQVQGVFFRKFTVAKAQALHLVGWCANTQRGTVMGECQGKPQALEEMKVRTAVGAA